MSDFIAERQVAQSIVGNPNHVGLPASWEVGTVVSDTAAGGGLPRIVVVNVHDDPAPVEATTYKHVAHMVGGDPVELLIAGGEVKVLGIQDV